MPDASRSVTVGSTVGLHARPAGTFVAAVTESGHAVTVSTVGGASADARSILGILGLGVGHGDEVTLEVSGEDAEAVADRLAALLASNLDG